MLKEWHAINVMQLSHSFIEQCELIKTGLHA